MILYFFFPGLTSFYLVFLAVEGVLLHQILLGHITLGRTPLDEGSPFAETST
jgi:hypothetical protein